MADRPDDGPATEEERRQARKRVEERRDFSSHAVAYLVVNAFLVGIWAMSGRGYFWPIWSLGGWGVGLAFHAWDVFGHRPITDADVDREIRRWRG